jgi:phosphoserine phosphatase RsbU/P
MTEARVESRKAPSPPPRSPSRASQVSSATVRERLQVGGLAGELLVAQRKTILERVVALVWISMLMMPLAILTYVGLAAPAGFRLALAVTVAAMAAVMVLRLLVRAGFFDQRPHLAMFLLIGCVFGPVASIITQLTLGPDGSFFFSYFLIFLAATTLIPGDMPWMAALGLQLGLSWAAGVALGGGATVPLDHALYMATMIILMVLLSQVVRKLFLDEVGARLELRATRDALFSEMEVAQGIQTLLLPDRPELPGHGVAGVLIPADEVGGDYFDVLHVGGRRFLAIGDVSGHGVTSGLTMMMVRSFLVACLETDPRMTLPALYAALNRALRRNLERTTLRLYMTFALLEDLGDGKFSAVGGHLPALVWRKARGVVDEIELAGVWLGILPEIPAEGSSPTPIELQKGDVLLLYTDGITERFRGDEMYGMGRLRGSFASAAPGGAARVVERLMADLEAFSAVQEDDVTLLAVHRLGEPTAPRS